jgi:hypothetical protein
MGVTTTTTCRYGRLMTNDPYRWQSMQSVVKQQGQFSTASDWGPCCWPLAPRPRAVVPLPEERGCINPSNRTDPTRLNLTQARSPVGQSASQPVSRPHSITHGSGG